MALHVAYMEAAPAPFTQPQGAALIFLQQQQIVEELTSLCADLADLTRCAVGDLKNLVTTLERIEAKLLGTTRDRS